MLSLGTTFLKYLQSLLRYYFDASVESFFLPLYSNYRILMKKILLYEPHYHTKLRPLAYNHIR